MTQRQAFAAELAQRFAKKGKLIRAEASGADGARFELSWPAKGADLNHVEQIKRAEPFHSRLRLLGFRSLVLKVGERVVWSGKL